MMDLLPQQIMPPKLIGIVGPTGSGKSQLAIGLAQEMGAEILSTDSVQVYQRLDIGSAKPSPSDRQRVRHHQIDIIPPDALYSAGMYEKESDIIIQTVHSSGKNTLVVGGTGLYFQALLYGICETPPIPGEVKDKISHDYQTYGLDFCYQQLQQLDPQKAQHLHSTDTSRVLRALEVICATGQSISTFQEQHGFSQRKYPVFLIGYEESRDVLYERINQRTLQMLEEGWIEEVQTLLEDYPASLKCFHSIGYKQVVDFLSHAISYGTMVEQIQQKTRNYAKRQLTWFRKNPEIHWIIRGQESQILCDIENFLKV